MALGVLAVTLGFAACGGPGNGKSLEEANPKTTADSLSYFYGQLYAANYWQQSKGDTTFLTESARAAYLKGLEKGINMSSDDEAYNEGLLVGLQLAMNCRSFNKQYDIEINKDLLVQSMAYGLRSDSTVDEASSNKALGEIMDRVEREKMQRDLKEVSAVIAPEAKKLGMKEVNDQLFSKVDKPGTVTLKKGDLVDCSIVISVDGNQMDLPMPSETTIGQDFNPTSPIAQAISTMKGGETATFATSGLALFGPRSEQRGVKKDQMIKMVITLGVPKAAEIAPAAGETPDGVVKPADAE